MQPNKDEVNEKNNYDHNFQNKFCLCDSGYNEKEFMIRCIYCQDFYHLDHLKFSEEDVIINNES